MFYGTKYFKPISGWQMVEPRSGLLNLDVGAFTAKRGSLLAFNGSDQEFKLCDNGKGFAGFLTQDVDATGMTMLNFGVVRNLDYPLRDTIDYGTAIVPQVGALFEVEGTGTCTVGNLVCTSGNGAIAANTAVNTMLSCLNGTLRVAQTGDVPLFELLDPDLDEEVTNNRRILVKYNGPQSEVA